MGVTNQSRTAWILGLAIVALCGIGYLASRLLRPPAAQPPRPLPIHACMGAAPDGLCAVPSAPPPASQSPQAPLAAMMLSPNEPCPTGVCDPIGNGEGVYFAKIEPAQNKDYCLPGFCPEAFVNAGGGVTLVGRSRTSDMGQGNGVGHLTQRSVFVSVNGGADLAVTRIASENGALAITYKLNGQEHTAKGTELANVALKLRRQPDSAESTKLTLAPLASAASYPKYAVAYDASPGNPNPTPLCAGEAVSFLPDKRVETWSARVTNSDAVTMGCGSGAIAKCMTLGYTRWAAAGNAHSDQSDYAFASCLQAIRAAYYVGQGDFTSYTTNGTPLYMRDMYGIQAGTLDRLEALWSPEGAVCLSEWRHPELQSTVPHSVDTSKVPACGSPDWTANAKLATGLAQSQQEKTAQQLRQPLQAPGVVLLGM